MVTGPTLESYASGEQSRASSARRRARACGYGGQRRFEALGVGLLCVEPRAARAGRLRGEPFNGRQRHELPNQGVFASLTEATKVLIEEDHNHRCPRSAPGYRTPAKLAA